MCKYPEVLAYNRKKGRIMALHLPAVLSGISLMILSRPLVGIRHERDAYT
jgi:hypothetical protein